MLVLFVVLLDKPTDEVSRVLKDIGVHVLGVLDPPHTLFVDHQTTVEHPVLLHQVFGGRNSLVGIVRRLRRTCAQEGEGGGQAGGGDQKRSAFELLAFRIHG